MATGDDRLFDVPMPRPHITTGLSPSDVCEILATDARREIIKKVAMRGWVSIDELDANALAVLEEKAVIDIRGETAERGENFASVLQEINERATDRRENR